MQIVYSPSSEHACTQVIPVVLCMHDHGIKSKCIVCNVNPQFMAKNHKDSKLGRGNTY